MRGVAVALLHWTHGLRLYLSKHAHEVPRMETTPAPSFAALLRRFRVAVGLSQEALAERAGLSARAISDLERGVRRAPYRETVRLLADALDLSAAERAALEQAVRRHRGPRAPLATSQRADQPRPLTSLIGRDGAIHDLCYRLRQTNVRLLTLTGPPGIGKTRLALAVGAELMEAWPAGVTFVDLSPLVDPQLVATSILQALGGTETGSRSTVERLRDVIADKQLLLVLDNVEHLLPAAPLINILLEGCPGLRVLTTSRIALQVRGEQEYPVPPLAVPEPTAQLLVSAVEHVPAVRLFVERAQAVNPHFTLTVENAPVIAELCRRLDGLPLALELAAARAKVLPPQAMLTRLEHGLDVLASGPVDAPDRHRTLRTAIAWSHDLLSTSEQVLFRRLGVFVGGCTIVAAEHVAKPDGDAPPDVFSGVISLVNQSLLQQRQGVDTEPRFTMLETVRNFALEQLDAAGERAQVRAWHAADMLARAEEIEPHLYTGDRGGWLQRLSEEQDNIRAGLTWALEQDDPVVGLRLVGALWLWFQRRLLLEGRQWAEQLLAHPGARRSLPARASALFTAGHFAWLQGDVPMMQAHMTEAVTIWQQVKDARGLGRALPFLGLADQDDGTRARRLAEEGVGWCRAAGDKWSLALALTNLGRIAATWGDDQAAWPPLEDATALFRALGDDWLVALPLTSLGAIAWRAGNLDEAETAFAEALPRFRAIEDRRNTTQVLTNLGYVALARGQLTQAHTILLESLAFGREHGDRFNLPACLRGFGRISYERGDPVRAARLLAAAEAWAADTGTTRWPAERLGGPGVTLDMRTRMDQVTFAAAQAAGQRLTLAQLLEEIAGMGER